MNKLMAASGELQSAARAERNALAKVLTPTQLQHYDRIMREVENRIVRAAK
jgi:cytochrome P450